MGLLGEFLLSPARKLVLPLFDRQVKSVFVAIAKGAVHCSLFIHMVT